MDGQHMVFRWGKLLFKWIWKKKCALGFWHLLSKNICMRTKSLFGCNLVYRNRSSLFFMILMENVWVGTKHKFAEKNFFYQPFNLIQPTSRVSGNNKIEWLHTQLQECLVRRHIFRTISFTQNWKPWVPHSPDLNPFDFFLWWYLKDCLYWQSWWDKETEEQY